MEILETGIRYDLFHNIKLNTHNQGRITLSADEAIDVAYAIVDSYELDYKILDDLQTAYEEDKEQYEEDIEEKNKREAYFEAMDRDYDDYIFEEMNN